MSKIFCKNIEDIPGTIKEFAGISVPIYYLPCDGSSQLIASYPVLYQKLGGASSPFGSTDGFVSHFNLPDSTRRSLMGSGGSASGTIGNTVGSIGGEESHTLSASEMAPHSHGISSLSGNTGFEDQEHNHTVVWADYQYGVNLPYPGNASDSGRQWGSNNGSLSPSPTGAIGPTSGYSTSGENQGHTHSFSGVSGATDSGSGLSDSPHNNIQPSLVITRIIKF